MDLTPSIPATPDSAAYQALTVAAVHAASLCKKDANAAFIIFKTSDNTPSFLFGSHWQDCQATDKATADANAVNRHTPVGYAFFRDAQLRIPSTLCALDAGAAALLVAHKLRADPAAAAPAEAPSEAPAAAPAEA
jgi:hypothetical protein